VSTPESAEPVLLVQAEMPAPEIHRVAGGAAAIFSAGRPDRSSPNEDAAAIIPVGRDAGVLVVADGMGGGRAGAQASSLAVSALCEAVGGIASRGVDRVREAALGAPGAGGSAAEAGSGPGATSDRDAAAPFGAPVDDEDRREGGAGAGAVELRTAILDGIEAANRRVSELGLGAATTLSVVEIRDGRVRPYHVGDSRILVVGQRGRIKHQSIAHSPVGYAIEAGLIDERDAMHHKDRHLVSNTIGSPDMRIEVGPEIELARYDTLLIASDGLFDNLHIDEIVGHIRFGAFPRAARGLLEQSLGRMQSSPPPGDSEARAGAHAPSKPDDLTFIVFRRERIGEDRDVTRPPPP
jgi:serine/threonine protein phosphatase PrpC